MNLKENMKKKENLLLRFCKLTEEALLKIEQEQEEEILLIMEKREKLINELETVNNQLKSIDISLEDQGSKMKELETRILIENKVLQDKMEKSFEKLKENIGNNKKAIKINKAYQGQFDQSLYLNKKN